MSLLPYLLDDSSYLFRPSSRLLDQNFGMVVDPEELLGPLTVPRMVVRCPAGYLRNWRTSGADRDTGSAVTIDNDKFQASLDVQHFKPEEITVKVTDGNCVTIEGKHEEKQDEHGHIYRHFVRRYTVPKDCDMAKIESKLSSDGVLTICAPRVGDESVEHKSIPIQQTGKPAKAIEKKADDKGDAEKK